MKKGLSVLILALLIVSGCTHRRTRFIRRTSMVMGTVVNIDVPETMPWAADSAMAMFFLVDSLMSPVRENSDVARINAGAGRWVRVSPLTAECIRYAVKVGTLSGGAFDITAGKLVHLWHFDTETGWHEPPPKLIDSVKKFVDFRKIQVDGDSVWIAPGQRIDLGGIAKGFAIDLAARKLMQLGVRNALVDAGGDIFAIGEGPSGKWRIGIRDPFNSSGIMSILDISNLSVCTSGNYERFIEINGKRYSHIFDPRTGWPVMGVVSVTVVGPEAVMCDGLATAVFVLGKRAGIPLIESLDGYEALMVTTDDTVYTSGFRKYLESGR